MANNKQNEEKRTRARPHAATSADSGREEGQRRPRLTRGTPEAKYHAEKVEELEQAEKKAADDPEDQQAQQDLETAAQAESDAQAKSLEKVVDEIKRVARGSRRYSEDGCRDHTSRRNAPAKRGDRGCRKPSKRAKTSMKPHRSS